MSTHWIADRTKSFDSSGIRKVFDLAAKMKNPINLSIGQPDFDVPQAGERRLHRRRFKSGKNAYALTQGMPVLRDKLQAAGGRRLWPRRPQSVRLQRHQRRARAGHAVAREPRRRSDHFRSLLRHVPFAHATCGRRAGGDRYLSRFPHRCEQSCGSDHVPHQNDSAQQPRQSDGHYAKRRGNSGTGAAGG